MLDMAKRPPSPLGQNLRRLLLERGISQVQLCEATDISPVTVSRVITGQQQGLSVGNLNKVADYLGVDVGDLTRAPQQGSSSTAELIERFKRSPYARDMRPPAKLEELERIARHPRLTWLGPRPTEATIVALINAMRTANPPSDE